MSFQRDKAARKVLSSDHASLVMGGAIGGPWVPIVLLSIVLPSMLQLGAVALFTVSVFVACPVACPVAAVAKGRNKQ